MDRRSTGERLQHRRRRLLPLRQQPRVVPQERRREQRPWLPVPLRLGKKCPNFRII